MKDDNLNALHIALKILETACEQFVIRQAEKMDRKNKQAIMQAVQPSHQTPALDNSKAANSFMAANGSSRYQRQVNRQAIKYFESSESEAEEEEAKDGAAGENEAEANGAEAKEAPDQSDHEDNS